MRVIRCAWRKAVFIVVGTLFSFSPVYGGAEEVSHILKEGETLYAVSRKFNVPVDALVRINRIQDPGRLKAGTRLLIPDMYEVRKGDTLYGIARKHGIGISVLLSLNNLRENSILKPGELLYIPRKKEAVIPAPSPSPPVQTPAAAAGTREFFWPHPGAKKELGGKLEGISFEGKPGDTIFSVASGKVVWVGPYRGFGQVVFVQSEQGYIYVYAGNEDILVSPGDMVRRGQKIGTLGVHPYEQKSNLYFIVYKDGKPVRPEDAPRI